MTWTWFNQFFPDLNISETCQAYLRKNFVFTWNLTWWVTQIQILVGCTFLKLPDLDWPRSRWIVLYKFINRKLTLVCFWATYFCYSLSTKGCSHIASCYFTEFFPVTQKGWKMARTCKDRHVLLHTPPPNSWSVTCDVACEQPPTVVVCVNCEERFLRLEYTTSRLIEKMVVSRFLDPLHIFPRPPFSNTLTWYVHFGEFSYHLSIMVRWYHTHNLTPTWSTKWHFPSLKFNILNHASAVS